MERVLLPYGDTPLSLEVGRVLTSARAAPAPAALERALDACVSAARGAGEPVFVVPDRTRDARVARILPRLLARLGADRPACVFASGTHAPMSDDEMRAALGDAAALVRPVPHNCDRADFVRLPGGARVHRVVAEADLLVVLSELRFHYLAGFGGGRKMIAPGCADRATATRVHARSLEGRERPASVRPGSLDDNPLHQEIRALTRGLPPAVGVCVQRRGDAIVDAEGGELWAHHAALCARVGAAHRVELDAPVDRVVVSAGGGGHEVNLVQAHKALNAVEPVLTPGARVALVARCARGLGHADFARWASAPLEAQLDALASEFVIGRQTAWSWARLCARFEVGLLSALPDETARAVGARPLGPEALSSFLGAPEGRVAAPEGAALVYALRAA